VLRLIDICKSYIGANSPSLILDNVSFELSYGNSMSIQGPSGCGKSTLLHLIAALDRPDSGKILLSTNISGDEASPIAIENFSETQADQYRRQKLGMVFQRFNLIDCISVLENISLASRLNGALDQAYINELMERLNITEHISKLPTQLSGGEQQRVAIARALAHKPQLILADEPTGNLDEENSALVSQLLFDTCQQFNTTLIVVTHSPKVAEQASRQLYMQQKQLIEHA